MKENDISRYNKLRRCKWMLNCEIKQFDSYFSNFKMANKLHERLIRCLPDEEKEQYLNCYKNINYFNVAKRIDLIIRIKNDIIKILMDEEKKKVEKLENIEHFENNVEDIKKLFENYKEIEYKPWIPSKDYLLMNIPIEIIEYCDVKLIKYDLGENAACLLLYDDQYKVFFDKDAKKIEMEAEKEFDIIVQEKINNTSKINPFGEKETNMDINISNVTAVMGGQTDSSLDNIDNIF